MGVSSPCLPGIRILGVAGKHMREKQNSECWDPISLLDHSSSEAGTCQTSWRHPISDVPVNGQNVLDMAFILKWNLYFSDGLS